MGQKLFALKIELSQVFNNELVKVNYDNGKESINKQYKIVNGKLTITDSFYATYVRTILQIKLKKEQVTLIFYLSNDTAQLKYKSNYLSTDAAFISQLQHTNIYFLKEEKEYHNSYAAEYRNFNKMAAEYRSVSIKQKDSLYPAFNNSKQLLLAKKLKYLLRNPSSYVSFYFFKNTIALSDQIKPDSLLYLYNNYFKDLYSESNEGKALHRFLLGKCNAQVGNKALLFTGISPVNNDTIELAKYTNKYKLIIFWASWCGPCLKELPVLKKINAKYSADVEFISISADTDANKCINAIKKYNIYWHNLLNTEIVQGYGVAFIPQVFLLDKDNVVIYSSADSRDGVDLKKLQEKLSKEFKAN